MGHELETYKRYYFQERREKMELEERLKSQGIHSTPTSPKCNGSCSYAKKNRELISKYLDQHNTFYNFLTQTDNNHQPNNNKRNYNRNNSGPYDPHPSKKIQTHTITNSYTVTNTQTVTNTVTDTEQRTSNNNDNPIMNIITNGPSVPKRDSTRTSSRDNQLNNNNNNNMTSNVALGNDTDDYMPHNNDNLEDDYNDPYSHEHFNHQSHKRPSIMNKKPPAIAPKNPIYGNQNSQNNNNMNSNSYNNNSDIYDFGHDHNNRQRQKSRSGGGMNNIDSLIN